MAKTQFDIAIPIEIGDGANFSNTVHEARGPNDECGFRLAKWDATWHNLDGNRYLVVRTNADEAAAREAIGEILTKIAVASVHLDVGFRPRSRRINVAIGHLNLDNIALFSAGKVPLGYVRSGSATLSLNISVLGDAFNAKVRSADTKFKRACELFGDVDFEASMTSQMVLLTTALEIICERKQRDDDALSFITRWQAEAEKRGRKDLQSMLQNQRDNSISASIYESVRAVCESAGIVGDEQARLALRARKLYRQRSALVHGGELVLFSDLMELRQIVRFMLTGSRTNGPFSITKEWLEREKSELD
jgi:hypothetical protein